ncbi:hypothetical protein CkaCkLH20_05692 [Colletotrichum karsti]|uniref:Uncharacterized protein n=1 Tax=Colletotrichum karsti TaxID=1095194 RepID=A0A9P6IA92_9PEZI|nr:uncharacterized protein CkaCkLH20_05692 [Colletotrichum karsti]KAF9876846.1 hypothetical protein CkaCkLH20_05692 [Colletotrichum karsti]
MLANVVIVILAAVTGSVLGGSRAWEAPLHHEVQLDRDRFARIAVDEAGYAIRRVSHNDTGNNNINKRWFGVRAGAGPNPTRLWPDKTISYCYDTPESQAVLDEPFQLAIKMWSAGFEDGSGGLDPMTFKYQMVAAAGTACTRNSQRDKILVVSLGNALSTTVGRPLLNANNPDDRGPSMILSTNDNVELGGTVFGEHWDCQALKDFVTVRGKIFAKHGAIKGQEKVDEMCVSQAVAVEWGFSASDWLPIKANYIHPRSVPLTRAGYKHVDWESIMLYPSGAGGGGSARPPTNPSENPDVYDQRTPVLLRNDGSKIRTNAIPSKGDVAGIKYLYEGPVVAAGGYILPNDKKHKRFPNFMKDLMGKKGKSCENPS